MFSMLFLVLFLSAFLSVNGNGEYSGNFIKFVHIYRKIQFYSLNWFLAESLEKYVQSISGRMMEIVDASDFDKLVKMADFDRTIK